MGTSSWPRIQAATYHDNPCPPTAFVCLDGIGGRGLPTALGGDRLGGGAIVGALLVGKEPLRIPLEDLAGRPYVLLGWQSIWSAVNRPG